MAFGCRVVLDSLGPSDVRLTTLEVTIPRIVLAEFNTHRMFSRNSASSRAIPVKSMLERVKADPFVPVWWGKNQKGMQAAEELEPRFREMAERAWLNARDNICNTVEFLAIDLDLHKQIANRLLEPWMWQTIIVTATEWDNFFNLRLDAAAQPEIRKGAELMKAARDSSKPAQVPDGKWHLPLVAGIDEQTLRNEGYTDVDLVKISCARCARVSYLTHDGKRDPKADIELHDRLLESGHMSPFEHAAMGVYTTSFNGNFRGWLQYRKTLRNEDVFKGGA